MAPANCSRVPGLTIARLNSTEFRAFIRTPECRRFRSRLRTEGNPKPFAIRWQFAAKSQIADTNLYEFFCFLISLISVVFNFGRFASSFLLLHRSTQTESSALCKPGTSDALCEIGLAGEAARSRSPLTACETVGAFPIL